MRLVSPGLGHGSVPHSPWSVTTAETSHQPASLLPEMLATSSLRSIARLYRQVLSSGTETSPRRTLWSGFCMAAVPRAAEVSRQPSLLRALFAESGVADACGVAHPSASK